MKPKLRPAEYGKPFRHEPVLDYGKLMKRFEAFLPSKHADQLAFDLMELDEEFDSLRTGLKRLFSSLRAASRDSTDLFDESSALAGAFEHLRLHIRSAIPTVRKLHRKARELPPIDKATDLQLTERTLAPFDEIFAASQPRPKWSAKKKTGAKKKVKTKKKTAAKKKSKKKRS